MQSSEKALDSLRLWALPIICCKLFLLSVSRMMFGRRKNWKLLLLRYKVPVVLLFDMPDAFFMFCSISPFERHLQSYQLCFRRQSL